MARPKSAPTGTGLDSRNLVVRKLVLHGIGDACVGTDETGTQYTPIVFLGPLMRKEVEITLEDLGPQQFRRDEGLLAINLCRFAHHLPSFLEARPHAITG